MRVRVTTVFRDINTHEIYAVGAEREFDEARAKHLLNLGLVELAEKPEPTPVPEPEPAEAKAEQEPAEAKEETKEEESSEVETKTEEPSEHEPEPAAEEPQEKVVSERRRGRKPTKQ